MSTDTEQVATQESVRVGEITGERPCVACGYSLRRQPIEREPHYGLLIARCPECGTVAALQEYPALSATVGRLRMLGAALIALFLLLLTAAHVGLSAGAISIVQVGEAGEESAILIAEAWKVDFDAAVAEGEDPYRGAFTHLIDADGNVVAQAWTAVSQEWWEAQEQSRFVPSFFESAMLPITSEPGAVLVIAAVLAAVGLLWSVVLQSRRAMTMVIAVVPIAIAAVIMLETGDNSYRTFAGQWLYAQQLAQDMLLVPSIVFGSLAAAGCTLLGVWQGRRITRFVIRAILPPDLRGAFVGLWLHDGLEPPSGSRAPARDHPEARVKRSASE